MESGHSIRDYNNYVKNKQKSVGRDRAMADSIGGNFTPFGLIMRDLLLQYGMSKDSTLLDLGCGSGRLANALKEMPELHYIGIDVVQDLLDYAASLSQRPDWSFHRVSDFQIPLSDKSVDMVTAFSLFTHLLHEESYIYLHQAKRVLKPGGRLVFSFLDFTIPQHWSVFLSNIRNVNDRPHLNQFIDQSAIQIWCRHLNFELIDILPGNQKYVRLSQPVTLDDGSVEEYRASLGQSVCILEKPMHDENETPYITAPPGFDPALYLEANPDVAKAGVNALDHFLGHGQFEGRKISPK